MVMKSDGWKRIYNRLRGNRYINKYTVTLAAFVIWMVFFDANSVVNQIATYRRQVRVNREIEHYRREIEKNNTLLEALGSDTEALERFARENYRMKRRDEDVYIIRED